MVNASKNNIKVLTHKNGKPKTFYKITNKYENHNQFQYKTGLNILKQKFEPNLDCGPGGLYFAEKIDILDWCNLGENIREVQIPVTAKLCKLSKKYKADRIILLDKYPLYSLKTFRKLFGRCVEKTVFTMKNYFLRYLKLTRDSLEDQFKFFNKRSYMVDTIHPTHFYTYQPELTKLLLKKNCFSKKSLIDAYNSSGGVGEFHRFIQPYIK